MRDFRTVAVGFGAGLLGAAVAVTGLGAVRDTPGQVVARQFLVIGEDGQTRLELSAEKSVAQIRLFDASGVGRLMLSVEPGGKSGLLVGNESASTLMTATPTGRASLGVVGTHGAIAAVSGTPDRPWPVVETVDASGKVLFRSDQVARSR